MSLGVKTDHVHRELPKWGATGIFDRLRAYKSFQLKRNHLIKVLAEEVLIPDAMIKTRIQKLTVMLSAVLSVQYEDLVYNETPTLEDIGRTCALCAPDATQAQVNAVVTELGAELGSRKREEEVAMLYDVLLPIALHMELEESNAIRAVRERTAAAEERERARAAAGEAERARDAERARASAAAEAEQARRAASEAEQRREAAAQAERALAAEREQVTQAAGSAGALLELLLRDPALAARLLQGEAAGALPAPGVGGGGLGRIETGGTAATGGLPGPAAGWSRFNQGLGTDMNQGAGIIHLSETLGKNGTTTIELTGSKSITGVNSLLYHSGLVLASGNPVFKEDSVKFGTHLDKDPGRQVHITVGGEEVTLREHRQEQALRNRVLGDIPAGRYRPNHWCDVRAVYRALINHRVDGEAPQVEVRRALARDLLELFTDLHDYVMRSRWDHSQHYFAVYYAYDVARVSGLLNIVWTSGLRASAAPNETAEAVWPRLDKATLCHLLLQYCTPKGTSPLAFPNVALMPCPDRGADDSLPDFAHWLGPERQEQLGCDGRWPPKDQRQYGGGNGGGNGGGRGKGKHPPPPPEVLAAMDAVAARIEAAKGVSPRAPAPRN